MNETTASSRDPQAPAATPAAAAAAATGASGVVLASRAARLGAFVLDTAIPLAMIGVPLFLSGLVPAIEAVASGELPDVDETMAVGAMVAMILLLAWTVLTTVFVYRNSQTVGKKLLGIKVVRSDGSRAGINRLTWLRNVVNALPSFIPVVGLVVGPLYWVVDSLFIFGRTRQCLHDRIADTIVIRA